MAPGSTFCDIGSGVGEVCLQLAKEHSHLKVTLQDQPHVLETARGVRPSSFLFLIFTDDNA
jgi:ubiquinone/menaquinone biosynthesis C-methylase UbiE